jgi:hypothetical protein
MVRRVCAQHLLEFGIGNFGAVLERSVRACGSGSRRKYCSFDWFRYAFAVGFCGRGLNVTVGVKKERREDQVNSEFWGMRFLIFSAAWFERLGLKIAYAPVPKPQTG